MNTISIAMPQPISANNLFANVRGRGRIKSKRYNTWIRHADALLMRQAPLPSFGGPVTIEYFVGQEGVGNMDAGNAEKAYTDALVRAGVILDDSRKWVRGITVSWVQGMTGCVARVSPHFQEPSASAVVSMVPDYDGTGALQVKGQVT